MRTKNQHWHKLFYFIKRHTQRVRENVVHPKKSKIFQINCTTISPESAAALSAYMREESARVYWTWTTATTCPCEEKCKHTESREEMLLSTFHPSLSLFLSSRHEQDFSIMRRWSLSLSPAQQTTPLHSHRKHIFVWKNEKFITFTTRFSCIFQSNAGSLKTWKWKRKKKSRKIFTV